MDATTMAEDEKVENSAHPVCPGPVRETIVSMCRTPVTQAAFDEVYLREKRDRKTLAEQIRNQIYCSKRRSWKLLSSYLPVVKFVRYYRPREFALTDLMAGLSVAVLHIPNGLAFGLLSSVKLENGLFTSVWPVLIYILFGTSAHVSMGTSAVVSILTGAIVDRMGADFASTRPWLRNVTAPGENVTLPLDSVPEYLDYKEEISMAIALVSGLMMIALGIFKLGFITCYLSDSFFAAFTSAAALHIAVSQLPAMLGLQVAQYAGVFKIVRSCVAIISALARDINWASLVISILVCVVVQLVKDCVNERFKRRLPAPIPVDLVVVILATLISYLADFKHNFGIAVVGKIPSYIPAPVLPIKALEESNKYLSDCFVLAILIFAYTIAIAKICAKKHDYEVDNSQEMIAYGLCNFVSSFFKCFPSCVAPSRSMVASNMNAKTTLSGIYSVVVMLMFILFIGTLFEAMPRSALAAIIFVSLKGLVVQIVDCRKFWRINKFDFAIWLCTFFSTVFLDIDYGLFVGVGVSFLTVVFQSQFVRGDRLGKTANVSVMAEIQRYAQTSEIPGVRIFRFRSSLYFANADIFRTCLYRSTANPRKLLKFLKKHQKLGAEAPERLSSGRNDVPESEESGRKRQPSSESEQSKELEKSQECSSSPSKTQNGSISIIASRLLDSPPDRNLSARLLQTSPSRTARCPDDVKTNGQQAQQFSSLDSGISSGRQEADETDDDEETALSDEKMMTIRKIHHVIIDCTPFNYVDSSGCNVLSQVYTEYGHVGIKVFLAGCSENMLQSLKNAEVLGKIPREHIFLHLEDAAAVAQSQKVPSPSLENLNEFPDDEDFRVTRM